MSLQATASAAKQVYDLLVQIQQLLNQMQITTKGKTGGATQIKESEVSLRQIRLILFDVVYLMRTAGLGDDFTAVIAKVAQVTAAVTALIHSIHLLEIASGPVGWLLAATSIASTAVYLGSTVASPFGTSSIGERARMFG